MSRKHTPGPPRGTVAGVAWGTVLWLVAAGVVMPIWLQVVGIPSPLPNLPRLGFLSHALWGVILGGTYVALGRLEFDVWRQSVAVGGSDP